MLSSSSTSQLKRKRRSSDHSSELHPPYKLRSYSFLNYCRTVFEEDDFDIENLPTNEEKKHKDEGNAEPSCSFEREGDRQPFSELKVKRSCSQETEDANIDALVSDQERLSLSEEVETASGVTASDVAQLSDLSPEAASLSPCSSNWPLTPSSSSYHCEEMDEPERKNILPPISWADLPSLWGVMMEKDEFCLRTRDPDIFSLHPSLTPRMRAVLLDWIAEVCEVYRLHRETYYLTMDYIDRYLSAQVDVPKQQLQLIGVTCLQIACKNEEVYPPKMAEYAYVTDGACTEKEIIAKEAIICSVLDWRFNPMTPVSWLKLYLQVLYAVKARHDLGFLYPAYDATIVKRVAHLLNLSTLDSGSLRYSYSMLAAAALYLACHPQLAVTVSGLDEEDLSSCVNWMAPFWDALMDEIPEYNTKIQKLKPGFTKQTVTEDEHNLQKHDISLSLLDSALSLQASRAPSCFLTPPSSSKKVNVQQQNYT